MKRRVVLSLRARLAIWTTVVVTGIFVLSAAAATGSTWLGLQRGLDVLLREDFERHEHLLGERTDGSSGIHEEHDASDPARAPAGVLWSEVWSDGGELLHRSPALGGRALGPPPAAGDGEGGPRAVPAELPDGEAVRMICGPVATGGRRVLLRLARSEAPIRHQVRHLGERLLLVLPFALLLAAGGGWFLAGRSLAPVGAIAARAAAITSDRLSERLPVADPDDELGRLTIILNDLLGRLDRSFEELRRFTADASHELRTPLAALQAVGEVGLRGERTPEAYRDVLGSMLEEVGRLSGLVDGLLLLSRSPAAPPPAREEFDLGDLAREIAARLGVLAEERGQSLAVETEAPARVLAGRVALDRALANLVDNAIRYTPAGGRIVVRIAVRDGEASIEVEDDGPGIAPEHRERIFDRFYRVDPARTRASGGAGLGLAIVKSLAEREGGRVELTPGPGRGSRFRMVLPSARPDRPAG